MNKKVGVFLLALVAVSISISFISAAATLQDLSSGFVNGVIGFFKPYVGALLNSADTSYTNEVFMGKFLVALIFLTITYVILRKSMSSFFAEKTWLLWVISIAVTVLGTRGLSPEMIQTIILPNTALAVAITAGLPFFIYYTVVSDWQSLFAKRLAWIFFGVIYLGLYQLRVEELGSVGYIYPFTALLALLLAIFQGTLQKALTKARIERAESAIEAHSAIAIQMEIANATTVYNANPGAYVGGMYASLVGASKNTERGTSAYLKDLRALQKELAKFSP